MAEQEFDTALRAAQKGRPAGVRALVQAHQPALSRVLAGLGVTEVAPASVRIWRAILADLGGFSGDEYGFRAWLLDVTQELLPGFGRRAETGSAHDYIDLTDAATGPDTGPWDTQDGTAHALTLVRDLPADVAQAVLLRVVAGLDPLTVADRTAEAGGRTRRLYQRGLADLVRRWAVSAPDPSEPGPSEPGADLPPSGSWGTRAGVDDDRVEELLDSPEFEPQTDDERELADLVSALRAPETAAEHVATRTVLAGLGLPPARSHRVGGRAAGTLLTALALTAATVGGAAAATGSVPEGLGRLASLVSWQPGWMQRQLAGDGASPSDAAGPEHAARHGDDRSATTTSAPAGAAGLLPGRPPAPAGTPPATLFGAASALPPSSSPVPTTATSPPAAPAVSPSAAATDEPTGSPTPSPEPTDPTTTATELETPSPSIGVTTTPSPPSVGTPGSLDALGLCQAWAAAVDVGGELPVELQTQLVTLAGGADRIEASCAAVLAGTAPDSWDVGGAVPTTSQPPAP